MTEGSVLDKFYTPWQRHETVFALSEKYGIDIYAAAEKFKEMEALAPDDLKKLIDKVAPNEQAPGWKPDV